MLETCILTPNIALQGVGTQITIGGATSKVGEVVGKATEALGAIQTTMKGSEVQATMQKFSMANEKMNFTSEMIDDAMDNALDDDDTEQESNELIDQVRRQTVLSFKIHWLPVWTWVEYSAWLAGGIVCGRKA